MKTNIIKVRAECQNCKFVRNKVGIDTENNKFVDNAGYSVLNHLSLHRNHIIAIGKDFSMKKSLSFYKLKDELLVRLSKDEEIKEGVEKWEK